MASLIFLLIINVQPNFKAQYKNIDDFEDFTEQNEPEVFVLGYDDDISKERRELIRNSIIARSMQHYDYHSTARKNSDEVVNQIAKEQGYDLKAGSKKDVNTASLASIWNFGPVELNKNNGFRGSEPKSYQLQALKKSWH